MTCRFILDLQEAADIRWSESMSDESGTSSDFRPYGMKGPQMAAVFGAVTYSPWNGGGMPSLDYESDSGDTATSSPVEELDCAQAAV